MQLMLGDFAGMANNLVPPFLIIGEVIRDWLGEDTLAEWEKQNITGWSRSFLHRKSGFALPLLEDLEAVNPAPVDN
jgi:hypothetical protein